MLKPTKKVLIILFGLFAWNYFVGLMGIWPTVLWQVHFPLLNYTIVPNVSILVVADVIWWYFIASLFAYYIDFLLTKTKWLTGKLFISFAALSCADLVLSIGFWNIGGGNTPMENFIASFAGTLFVYMVLLSFFALAVLVVRLFHKKEA